MTSPTDAHDTRDEAVMVPREIGGSSPRRDLADAAMAHRPSDRGYEYSLQQYDGTNVLQWHRRNGVAWYPCGPLLNIPAARPASPVQVGEVTNEQIQTAMLGAAKEVRATLNADEWPPLDEDIARLEAGPVDMDDTSWAIMRATCSRLASLSAPIARGGVDREAVARIIEPAVWTLKDVNPDAFETAKTSRSAKGAYQHSLRAADAILALLNQDGEGGK